MYYVAKLAKEGRRTLIEFPDAPGSATFAEPNDDVHDVAREAIEGWLIAHLEDGEAPARPRTVAKKGESDILPVRIDPHLAVRLQLRWARQDAGVSQSQLAERVGVSRQQISLLESPDANLTLRTLEKVATALGLSVDIALVPEPAHA